MPWVVVLGWGIAIAVALVVLGFCGYEVTWKSARFRRELGRLQALQERLANVQVELALTRRAARSVPSAD